MRVALALAAAALAAAPAAAAPAPRVPAEAALVVNASSGEVLHERAADERHSVASATKLMTALLTLERADLDTTLRAADYSAAPVESQIGLRRGERMTVRDLLVALMLESANDAAATLAERIGGSRERFVRLMNRRARALGLHGTSYANPIGFDDPANYSTARDLAALARRLLKDRTFAAIVNRPRAELVSGARRRVVRNRNRLVGQHRFVDGVKTGHTLRARYVLVGAAHGNGARIVTVVLGAPSEAARDSATLALLRWGVDQYRRVRALRARVALGRARVEGHDGERIPLVVRRDEVFTLRRGERLHTRLAVPDTLRGPLPRGARVGTAEVRYLGRVVRRVPVVAGAAVPAPPSRGPAVAALALLAVATAAALAVARSRRRARHRHRRASA